MKKTAWNAISIALQKRLNEDEDLEDRKPAAIEPAAKKGPGPKSKMHSGPKSKNNAPSKSKSVPAKGRKSK